MAEQSDIEHERQPNERMPVPHQARAERPPDAVQRQAVLDMDIIHIVSRVVIGQKSAVYDRPVNRQCDRSQQKTKARRMR